jgi:hypothetical protein
VPDGAPKQAAHTGHKTAMVMNTTWSAAPHWN